MAFDPLNNYATEQEFKQSLSNLSITISDKEQPQISTTAITKCSTVINYVTVAEYQHVSTAGGQPGGTISTGSSTTAGIQHNAITIASPLATTIPTSTTTTAGLATMEPMHKQLSV